MFELSRFCAVFGFCHRISLVYSPKGVYIGQILPKPYLSLSHPTSTAKHHSFGSGALHLKKGMLKKRRSYKTRYIKRFCRFILPIESLFILRTNFAARRTFVRLRASKIQAFAFILLNLSVLHLFFYPLKKDVKNIFYILTYLIYLHRSF